MVWVGTEVGRGLTKVGKVAEHDGQLLDYSLPEKKRRIYRSVDLTRSSINQKLVLTRCHHVCGEWLESMR